MLSSILPEISVIVPVYNEAESLILLVEKINAALQNHSFEILLIDDGSTDNSWQIIKNLATEKNHILGIRHRRNFNKSQAIDTALLHSRGSIIITIDADLQDDPAAIPMLLKKMEEGYDFVTGWKKERHDPLSKTLPSRIFNAVVSRLFRLKLHDFNCGLKAFYRQIFLDVRIYGELHRFLPVFAHVQGYHVAEIPVQHQPRQFGISKYGVERLLRGFIDLFTMLLITRFKKRPAHLFGGIGLFLGGIGGAMLTYLILLWCFTDEPIGTRPLLTFGALLSIVGIQFLFFGMLAEFVLYGMNSNGKEHLISDMTPKLTVEK